AACAQMEVDRFLEIHFRNQSHWDSASAVTDQVPNAFQPDRGALLLAIVAPASNRRHTLWQRESPRLAHGRPHRRIYNRPCIATLGTPRLPIFRRTLSISLRWKSAKTAILNVISATTKNPCFFCAAGPPSSLRR